ncbi:2-acylglycerol O-acyltransferase 2-A-like isoform X2 [Anneissia japonica]|uniref:2-acylglycerol O-acyltransferase 2-A-like isoform X2 n=1 Tax=Anneissia japonica TaxID=1529436 RepID=UPI0014259767|nr:2-acylglycerol O-acyltransferase 2-A-like isoform X2 [Anneissia japonica]
MNVFGIRFAPLSIPFHRRIETFAVAQFCILFVVGGIIFISLTIYLFTTSYYWFPLLYCVWLYFDWNTPSRGGRRGNWMIHGSLWRHMSNYFPARLHKTVDLDPNHNYLLGFHPHGVMAVGAFMSFATEANGFSLKFPGIRPTVLTLAGQFGIPFWRDYLMSAVCSVSRESVDYVLGECGDKGNAVIIVVGGALESLQAHPNAHTLVLRKRKGFVKKAIYHGAHLVPVYSFGETDIYDQLPNPEGSKLRKFQIMMTKIMGFAPPIFHGRGIFNYTLGIVPYRKPINTIVGKPIPIMKDTSPSSEKVDRIHQEYMDALESLFEEHKLKFGVDAAKRLTFL